MDKTLIVINKMLREGLFRKYAIGGGIGALFYIEPMATFELKNTFDKLRKGRHDG